MKVTAHKDYTVSLRASDDFFLLLIMMFENMNDEELYRWVDGKLPMEYARKIVKELRRKLL